MPGNNDLLVVTRELADQLRAEEIADPPPDDVPLRVGAEPAAVGDVVEVNLPPTKSLVLAS
mgnify:CR=1 FL=1